MTTSGRVTGQASSKKAPPSENHFLNKLDELRLDLHHANEVIANLNEKIATLSEDLAEKEHSVRSYARQNVELKRRLAQLIPGNIIRYFLKNVFIFGNMKSKK